MQESNTAGIFVIHLLSQMNGMEDIGNSTFVDLSEMSLISNFHGFVG
jgi:hypothetical protein